MSRPTSTSAGRLGHVLPGRRQILWGLLAALVLALVGVGVGYATTTIPSPSSFATQQATVLYYSDGRTKLATLGQTTRVDVPLSAVPLGVRHAVLAAEDRHFYTEPGVSPTGILRALITDIRGGEISQGGSTITQQYVKNAYLTSARTFTRKFKEIFIATKLANSRPKSEILRDYLNTIYFGRGAYGIQAAANAYFREPVQKLTVAQGAVLAALISNPSGYDPANNPAAARARWHYVIDGMLSQHWLTQAQHDRLRYPKVRKHASSGAQSSCSGDIGFICQAVEAELNREGFDEARLSAGGYKVVTTIDKQAQRAAEQAMAANNGQGTFQTKGPDKGREAALVSVQPGDGAIRAMYGGDSYCAAHRQDSCTDLSGVNGRFGNADYTRPAGSSFKPYTLITALEQGIGLNSVFSGPPSISVNGTTINNSEGESCAQCTLQQALAESINTIFVPLAQRVGPDKVVTTAYDAGIPKRRRLAAVPDIALGADDVSPLDQAEGFATIAAQGERAQPYLVAKVISEQGDVVYKAKAHTAHAFDGAVMSDTTYAMTKVFDCAEHGTACGRALPGRPAAGKTGTNGTRQGNKDAWFVGFTPQLSTAVWYGNVDRKKPVTNHGVPVYGADLPAQTWQAMMTAALQGKPVEQFPPPAHVGHALNSPSPTPTQTAPPESPTHTTTPSVAPTTPPPTHSPLPSPSPSPSVVPTTVSPEPTSSSGGGTSPKANSSPAPGPSG